MNRRKFMKHSLAAGVAASTALRLDGEAFAADGSAGVGRSVTLPAKPGPLSLDHRDRGGHAERFRVQRRDV